MIDKFARSSRRCTVIGYEIGENVSFSEKSRADKTRAQFRSRGLGILRCNWASEEGNVVYIPLCVTDRYT